MGTGFMLLFGPSHSSIQLRKRLNVLEFYLGEEAVFDVMTKILQEQVFLLAFSQC